MMKLSNRFYTTCRRIWEYPATLCICQVIAKCMLEPCYRFFSSNLVMKSWFKIWPGNTKKPLNSKQSTRSLIGSSREAIPLKFWMIKEVTGWAPGPYIHTSRQYGGQRPGMTYPAAYSRPPPPPSLPSLPSLPSQPFQCSLFCSSLSLSQLYLLQS